jgi:GNAT superfamily N-acetyltransferase
MPTMSLVVRPAVAADRAVLHALLTAQLVEHALPADADGIARGIELALAPHSPAWLWLAERDGRAVGVFLANQIVSVELGGSSLWVEETYVVPEARRSGVARELLRAVCDEARRRGLRAVELEVVRTQAAAFALWRALGFTDVNRQRMSLAL